MKFKIEIVKNEGRNGVYTYQFKDGGEIVGSYDDIVNAFHILFLNCPKTIPCAAQAILNVDENDEDLYK